MMGLLGRRLLRLRQLDVVQRLVVLVVVILKFDYSIFQDFFVYLCSSLNYIYPFETFFLKRIWSSILPIGKLLVCW